MKKISAVCAVILLLAGCGKDNPSPQPSPAPLPTPTPGTSQLPAWNKANTAYVSVIGSFDNNALGKDSVAYQPVISLASAAKQSSHAIILDRCDVDPKAGFNGLVYTSARTGLFNMFALNKYNGTNAEGNGILIKHSIRSQKSYSITGECNLKLVETRRTPDKVQAEVVVQQGVPFYLGNVNFDSADQVTAAKRMLKYALDNSYGVIGTTTPALFDVMTESIKDVGVAYRLEKITMPNKGKIIFLLSPRNMVLREVATSVSGIINSELLSIECDVVY